jgi:hypothetical protein
MQLQRLPFGRDPELPPIPVPPITTGQLHTQLELGLCSYDYARKWLLDEGYPPGIAETILFHWAVTFITKER